MSLKQTIIAKIWASLCTSNTEDLCSSSAQLKFCLDHQLSWLKFSLVSLITPRLIPGIPWLCHELFPPSTFQLVIYQSFYMSVTKICFCGVSCILHVGKITVYHSNIVFKHFVALKDLFAYPYVPLLLYFSVTTYSSHIQLSSIVTLLPELFHSMLKWYIVWMHYCLLIQ